MAEKANLMLEAAKKNEEIERLTAAVDKATEEINALPDRLSRAKQEARGTAQASFLRRQAELRSRIEAIITNKRKQAEDLIDSFPDKDVKDFAGRFEIEDLEEHLKGVYPVEMITDYVCIDPIDIADDEEAFRMYSSVENMVMSLTQGGGLSASIFNGINQVLDTVTDDPRVGMKIIPAIMMFYAVGVLFMPFLFLTVFSVVGFASAGQGFFVKGLLRKLFSVKAYLNTSYNEDIFQTDRLKLLRNVDNALEPIRKEWLAYIDSQEFKYDPKEEVNLDKKFQVEKKRLEQSRDLNNTSLQRLKDELAEILAKIDELEDEEKKRAETARKKYLETVAWEHAWMEHAFIDVSAENKLIMMPFIKGNSCYYSKDEEELKRFSRLIAYQCMLRMHPEFATQVVLDYKYMGGELTQFLTLGGKCINIRYSEEDVRKQTEIITNEIKARTKSILSSSANLDEFNALMATYGATGEYYAIVHIFGLEALSSAMKNWFHNGPRVGYIFKFYWTVDEMQSLKDDLPLADIKDFYEISGNPIPRTAAAVKRIIGLDS